MNQASEVHGDLGAAVAPAFETKMEALSGLAAQAKPERQRYRWKRDLDQALREGYRAGPDSKQRAIDQICLMTGWSRQACWDRARALDLTDGQGARPRKPWALEEIERLQSLSPRAPLGQLAEQLGRTRRSVSEKLKRVRRQTCADRRTDDEADGYTATEVAEAIGRSSRTVYRWISEGRLSGRPNPITGELCVEEEDFWRFVTLNYQEVLVHKVSRDYLEWLCAELLPLARPRIEQKGGRKKRVADANVESPIFTQA